MKKASVLIMLILSVILFPVPASAHKGNTDAYGGHYDRSTGEYHYHHGYGAHQHYDMDGDGIVDCPFNFDDKTGQSSGKSTTTKSHTKKEGKVIPDWVYYCFTGCAVAILILFIISKSRKYRIEEQNEELQKQQQIMEQELVKVKSATRDSLVLLLSDLEGEYGYGYLYSICRAPPDDYLGEDNLPESKEKNGHKWGEKYTFYFSGYHTSIKYHKISCRHANKMFPVNALTIYQGKNKYSPCAVCSPTLPDMQWAERVIRHKAFFEQYGISVKQHVPKIDISKNPDFGEITLEYVECSALEYGLPKETVLKIINQRRMNVGMRQIELDELYELE